MRKAIWFFLLFLLAPAVNAQSNDIVVTGGGYFAISNPLDLGAAWGMEVSFAHRIVSLPALSVSVELPVAASFRSSIPNLKGLTITRSYTSFFVTPGLSLRLAPRFPLSPYVCAGIGYARFNRHLFNGTLSTDSALGLDIGAGLDVRIVASISLRGELRDFNSGGPILETLAFGRQNNLFATLGFAVRF